jgi:hypothetical protein
MPKCVKCFEYLPPTFCIEIPNTEENRDEAILECVFCNTGKTEVTLVENDSGGKLLREEKYTKTQCIEDYKTMLKMMKESYKNGGVRETGILNIPEKIVKLH